VPGRGLLPRGVAPSLRARRPPADRGNDPSTGRQSVLGDEPGHQLAVVGRISEEHYVDLCALEVQVQVVLPRETDPAVHVDAAAGDAREGLTAVRLRDRRGKR